MLTANQIAKYHERGFVTPDFRLPADLIEEIKDAHSRLIAKQPDVSDYCSALLAFDPWFLHVARQGEILDMVCELLGEDVALWNCSFFAKPARTGSKTPWHQDGEYWPIDPLATCTVWIAIDDATTDNGCLRVIPGSHRSQQLARHEENNAPGLALNLELTDDQFDVEQAEDIILDAGQVSLHDVYLYHGSEANLSDKPRRGMTLRYMPMTSVYRHNQPTRFRRDGVLDMSQRTVYLLRGSDQTGENDFRVRY
jgi:ectoine hydroxylase-related dioxygenase (phytanoyl-CoA dioxygenase family)